MSSYRHELFFVCFFVLLFVLSLPVCLGFIFFSRTQVLDTWSLWCFCLQQPMCFLLQGLPCGWWMEKAPRRAGLRYCWMGSGAVSVMMTGQTEMPQWFAGNWGSGKSCDTGLLLDRNSSQEHFWASFWGLSLCFGTPTYAWGSRLLFLLYYCLCVEWHNYPSYNALVLQVHLTSVYCRLATLSLIAVVQQKPGQWLILVKAMDLSIWTT